MKVGIIGLGMMGKLHARVYSELGYTPLVFDIDTLQVKKCVELYGCIGFDSLDKMLSTKGLNAVSVAVPTPFHEEAVRKCFAAGCHVLLEKPIAEDLNAARSIVDLAKQKNLLLAVGYIENFNPVFKAILSLHKQEYFGEITSVNIKRVGGIPRSADNVILDLMTHDIGLLLSLFKSKPDDIYVSKNMSDDNCIINSAQALFRFGKTSASCETNWISPVKIRTISITGTDGCCEADLIKQTICFFDSCVYKDTFGLKNVLDERHIVKFSQEPLKAELTEFINASRQKNINKDDLSIPGEKGLEVLETTLETCKDLA